MRLLAPHWSIYLAGLPTVREALMIEIPTVLVLGAGSSVHCGYPLGGQLVSQLSRLRGSPELDSLPGGWTRDEAEDFLTRLSRSGHYSIDAFLESNREQADLGKYLIARELKKHEDLEALFPPNNSGWYQYLLNRLLSDDGTPDFAANRLTIVTFNYDRSLEAYLHAAVQARLHGDEDQAAAILDGLRVIHVHGVLGDYPAVPYERDVPLDELVLISRQIQIIHEIKDRDDGFCNPMFEEANTWLSNAERIYFLGFGFHPDNVRRFRFFTPDSTSGKLVRGTTTGLGALERSSLHGVLAPAGFTPEMLPPDGVNCNNFFSRAGSLD